MRLQLVALSLIAIVPGDAGAAGPPVRPRPWISRTIAVGRSFDRSDLVLRNGTPRIAYGTDAVYFAEKVGGAWRRETVDESDCANRPAQAAAPNGDPVLAYGSDSGLKFARRDSGRWRIQTVDDHGAEAAVSFDALGRPGIAYAYRSGGPEELRFAHHDGSRWQIETITTAVAHGTDLTFSAGEPVVSRSDYERAFVHRRAGSGWSETLVGAIVAPGWQGILRTSLARDGADRPVVAYAISEDTPQGTLFLAAESRGWLPEALAIAEGHDPPSLAATPSGELHLAFRTDSDLNWAHQAGSSWPAEVFAIESQSPSLAVEASDRPAASFLTRGALSLAQASGGIWSLESVDTGNGLVGRSPSLAVDGAGLPVVSHQGDYGRLLFTAYDGSAWVTELVDSATGPPSLALDRAGRPAIAYFSALRSGLVVTQRIGSTWSTTTVASSAHWGSLALDRSVLAVSYVSSGLQLAHFSGTRWVSQTVDPQALDGPSSLAFDAAGQAWIAYADRTNQQIRVAHGWGLSWDLMAVDATGFKDPTIAVDPAGLPAIAYTDWAGETVKLARWDGQAWITSIVAVTSDVASRPSLAFDASARPTITYFDDGQVLLARLEGAGWSVRSLDRSLPGPAALAFGPSGETYVAYPTYCTGDLAVTTDRGLLPVERRDRLQPAVSRVILGGGGPAQP